jgi:hypothetical protein
MIALVSVDYPRADRTVRHHPPTFSADAERRLVLCPKQGRGCLDVGAEKAKVRYSFVSVTAVS